MEIEVTQEKLSKALASVSRVAASARTTLPILSNVLIKAEDNKVSLTATNLDVAVVEYVPVISAKNGVITAPFRVSKRQCEMYKTSQDESVSKDRYKVSFNLMQKAIVGIQNQTVREAQGNV